MRLSISEHTVGHLLSRLGSDESALGGGASAAVSAALSAALVATNLRLSSRQITDAEAMAREVAGLGQALAALADAYGDAHQEVRCCWALLVPRPVALVDRGNRDLRGDAIIAVLLAEVAVLAAG